MKLKHVVSAGLAVCATAASSASAAPTVFSGNGHSYEFIRGVYSWEQALAEASALTLNGQSGYLATAASAEENAYIASLFGPNDFAWLGGSDADDIEGNYTWRAGPELGQAMTFTAWNGGEPNNAGYGESYLQMYANGKWNDAQNYSGLSFIVEFDPSAAVPEPATWALMIGGFGLAGAAMRRRSAAAVRA